MKYIQFFALFFLFGCTQPSEDELLSQAKKLEDSHDWKSAIEILDKTIALYPNSIKALLNRGADLSAIGEYNKAIKNYLTVIKLDSDNVLAHYNIGLNKNRLKKWDDAIKWFNKALDLKGGGPLFIEKMDDPFDVPVHEILFDRAVSYMDNENDRQLDRAIFGFENCVSNSYRVSESLNNIGCMLYWQDSTTEACDYFTRSMHMSNADAKENFEKLCQSFL